MAPVEVCQQCDGACCKKLSVGVILVDRLAELFWAHYGRKAERARFVVHHRCAHLDGHGLCDLWNADPALDRRPAICQEFMCERAENPDLMVLDLSAMEA